MALTEKIRLALEGKGFAKLFERHSEVWKELADGARDFIKPQVANGQPTVDDIKQVLKPVIELEKHFRKFLEDNPKLTQEYWSDRFTDYVLHRVYEPTLNVDAEGEESDE
ncbi:MAG: hypothetical protein AABO41_11225 [Acidobacteriota bacterium]